MSEPEQQGQQPPSEIWSRWRERRAARRAGSGEPQGGEPAAATPPSPEAPAFPESGPDTAAASDSRREFETPDEPAGRNGATKDAPPSLDEPSSSAADDPVAPEFVAAHDHECLDWCPICRTADIVRASVPPELREQWQDVQREALATLRAMIDHYLQRAEQQEARAARVEDIPIE
jgi:hypothetical protein